jgi:hypothetical protein
MSNERNRDDLPVCRTTVGFPCVDGPLVGEFHQQGDAFEFDGACAGLESGWYRLHNAVYVWEPTVKEM